MEENKEEYKGKIIDLVNSIDDYYTLEYLYYFIEGKFKAEQK